MMEPEEILEVGMDVAGEAAEPAGLPPAMYVEQKTARIRLAELETELEMLTRRQETLLFLATSPHSRYQVEADSNLQFLLQRIAELEREIRAQRFPIKN
jgi:hypothetical protein